MSSRPWKLGVEFNGRVREEGEEGIFILSTVVKMWARLSEKS